MNKYNKFVSRSLGSPVATNLPIVLLTLTQNGESGVYLAKTKNTGPVGFENKAFNQSRVLLRINLGTNQQSMYFGMFIMRDE